MSEITSDEIAQDLFNKHLRALRDMGTDVSNAWKGFDGSATPEQWEIMAESIQELRFAIEEAERELPGVFFQLPSASDKPSRVDSLLAILPRAIEAAGEGGISIYVLQAPMYVDEHDSGEHVYGPAGAVTTLYPRVQSSDPRLVWHIDARVEPDGSVFFTRIEDVLATLETRRAKFSRIELVDDTADPFPLLAHPRDMKDSEIIAELSARGVALDMPQRGEGFFPLHGADGEPVTLTPRINKLVEEMEIREVRRPSNRPAPDVQW